MTDKIEHFPSAWLVEFERQDSEGGKTITKAEAKELHKQYRLWAEDSYQGLVKLPLQDFKNEARALMRIITIPKYYSFLERLKDQVTGWNVSGRRFDTYSHITDTGDVIAEEVWSRVEEGEIDKAEGKKYIAALQELDKEVEEWFHSTEPGSHSEGECYYRMGGYEVVVGAPHEGYDLYTSDIAKDFAKLLPGRPVAYCEGFRKEMKFDVNRPSGKNGDEDEAREVMEKYKHNLLAANQWRLPRIVHEIHGKSDKGHPHTEIAFIGSEKQCGWNDAIRQQAKELWKSQTGREALVYQLDKKARLGHTDYQKDGLAGIYGWCGINIELSREVRDLWSSDIGQEGVVEQRAAILNVLSGLFLFAETTVGISKPEVFTTPLAETGPLWVSKIVVEDEEPSGGCSCNLRSP